MSYDPDELLAEVEAAEAEGDFFNNYAINIPPEPQLPQVSTQKTLTTPTADTIAKATERIRAGSSVGAAKNAAAGAVDSAKNTAQGLIDSLSGGLSSSSILGIPADIVRSAFKNSSLNFIDNNILANTQLGNFSTGLSDQINQFTSAMRTATASFSEGAANLQRQGLTFIASTTRQMIDGIDLPGLEDIGSFANQGIGQLGRLASLGGDALKSVGDGLKAVTSTVGAAFTAGKQALNTVVNSVVAPIGQVGSAILSPAMDIAQTAYTLTDPRFANALVQSNLSFLPGPLRDIAGYKAAQMVSNLTGDFHAKAANILNKTYALDTIFGVASTGNILEGLYNTGNGYGSYGPINNPYNYQVTGSGGTYVHGVSSYQGSASEYSQMANAVRTLCGNANIYEDYYNYSDDRDLFDMLLQAAMQTNAGQLIQALLNCTGSDNNSSYYTGRSTNVIRNNISNVAVSGDTYTYKTLLENKGQEVITDPKKDALALFVNARYDKEAKQDLDDILDNLGYTKEDLITTNEKIGNHSILDSAKVTLIQKAEKAYQSDFLTREEFAAVNAALALYGTPA